MECAKVFMNGGSQAVRLPKEFRFEDKELFVQKVGDIVMLIPKGSGWERFFAAIDMFTDDFMKEPREQLPQQEREIL